MTFKHLLTIFLFTASLTATADNNDTPPRPTPPLRDYMPSCTEGVITADFVEEGKMMTDLLQMLANFSRYMTADYQACVEPNSKGDYFYWTYGTEDTLEPANAGDLPTGLSFHYAGRRRGTVYYLR